MAKPLLTDELWAVIEPILPPLRRPRKGGRPGRPAPLGPHGHSVCVEDRHRLGRLAAGDGLRLRNDVLASAAPLDATGRLAFAAPSLTESPERGRPDRLVPRGGRQHQRPRCFWGEQAGPNPTDRRKAGSKHHVLSEGQGIPLVTRLTGANVHDVTQLIPLIDSIPPVAGKRGRPRRRPDSAYADRAYDSKAHRQELRRRRIVPKIPRRRTAHGSGLGRYRWVIERTNAWFHQFRRLRVRYDRTAEMHEAFMTLASCVICWRFLQHGFC